VEVVSQKRIPIIIDYNSKQDKQILIIFCTNIPDTTSHQTIVEVSTSPDVCFCTTWGKQYTRNRRWHEQETSKNIPDVIDCNLKKDDQILIVLVQVFLTKMASKLLFKFPPHPVCFCTTCKKQNKRNMRWNEQKRQ